MSPKIAIFPGSFDPFTIGHADIVERALPMFDQMIIAIGQNGAKLSLYSLNDRIARISKYYQDHKNIEVVSYTGLTADFCAQRKANTIIRGLRSVIDFEYEQSIAQMNLNLGNKPETIFLMCQPQHAHISSSMLRDIIKNNGDASSWMI